MADSRWTWFGTRLQFGAGLLTPPKDRPKVSSTFGRPAVATCGSVGRPATTEFVSGKPWVHLDIAGPAFVENGKPHIEGGGTGTMVRTLVELAAEGG